jgi:hypothetical protein
LLTAAFRLTSQLSVSGRDSGSISHTALAYPAKQLDLHFLVGRSDHPIRRDIGQGSNARRPARSAVRSAPSAAAIAR